MRRIEESALVSRWNERTLETSVLCAGLGLCALLIPSPLAGISVLAVSICLVSFAGASPRDYLRFLAGGAGFALVSLLPLGVRFRTFPWELGCDTEGLQAGILAGTRAVGTLSATLLLAFTTPFTRLVGVLHRWHCPGIAIDLLGLVHRQIFLLDERISRLRRALASRNGWLGIRIAFHSVALSATALLVQSVDGSQRLERGLASRGGSPGRFPRARTPVEVRPWALAGALALPGGLALAILWGRARLGL